MSRILHFSESLEESLSNEPHRSLVRQKLARLIANKISQKIKFSKKIQSQIVLQKECIIFRKFQSEPQTRVFVVDISHEAHSTEFL